MDGGPQKYELAFLLSPILTDEESLGLAGKLAGQIEEAGGIIRHQESPQKKRLSYLINKDSNAYFGWMTFTLSPDALNVLEKKLKNLANLLRHLIVNEEEVPPQPIRTFTPRPTTARSRSATLEPVKPEEKLDLEELDKKLEEILGK